MSETRSAEAPYTAHEVAEMLSCSEYIVNQRAVRGDLPGIQWGRSWVFPRGALHAQLDRLALEAASERAASRAPAVSLVQPTPSAAPRKPGRAPKVLPVLR